ncbi:hypothetical protein Bbelb_306740 [Branchiostoma belcheri]|nr:hypothetical protein Bbelb_306740 [Branchiostoma belcheri]
MDGSYGVNWTCQENIDSLHTYPRTGRPRSSPADQLGDKITGILPSPRPSEMKTYWGSVKRRPWSCHPPFTTRRNDAALRVVNNVAIVPAHYNCRVDREQRSRSPTLLATRGSGGILQSPAQQPTDDDKTGNSGGLFRIQNPRRVPD